MYTQKNKKYVERENSLVIEYLQLRLQNFINAMFLHNKKPQSYLNINLVTPDYLLSTSAQYPANDLLRVMTLYPLF